MIELGNYFIIGALVFGSLLIMVTRGLHTSGTAWNLVHIGIMLTGVILLGIGLTLALPQWFPLFRFDPIF